MTKKGPGSEGVRKQRVDTPLCIFCETYRRSEDDQKGKKLGLKGHRICAGDGHTVGPEDTCRHHELSKYLYCHQHNQEINVSVCLYRRSPACTYGDYHDICMHCNIGRALHYYLNGIEVKFIIKGENDDTETD